MTLLKLLHKSLGGGTTKSGCQSVLTHAVVQGHNFPCQAAQWDTPCLAFLPTTLCTVPKRWPSTTLNLFGDNPAVAPRVYPRRLSVDSQTSSHVFREPLEPGRQGAARQGSVPVLAEGLMPRVTNDKIRITNMMNGRMVGGQIQWMQQ